MAGRRFPKRCRHSLIIFKLYPVMGIKDFIMPTINQLVRKRRAKVEKLNKTEGKKIPFNYAKEPLFLECKAFIDWLKLDIIPPSSCEEGLNVLRVLELAKEKLKKW